MIDLQLTSAQAMMVAAGRTAGAWSVPQLGMTISEVLGSGGRRVGWTIAPTNYLPSATRGGWRQQRGADRQAWLQRHDLDRQLFSHRRHAHAALTFAASLDRPPFYTDDPCLHCDNSGWRAYEGQHQAPCRHCCPHSDGWSSSPPFPQAGGGERLESCREGCGTVRTAGPWT